MVLTNDERGWVMTCLSGIACALGASIICIDVIIRQFPGKRDFRIQDSDTFMSVSLSLSFGVMLFSALYSMLPSAKRSLIEGGNSPKKAGWILIACFIGGVVGIQVLSRALHHFMPSHVVDCEHSHDEDAALGGDQQHDHVDEQPAPKQQRRRSSLTGHLHRPNSHYAPRSRQSSQTNAVPQMTEAPIVRQKSFVIDASEQGLGRHDSIPRRMTRKLTEIAAGKAPDCDCGGPCYGYTDPCGNECFKKVSERGGFKAPPVARAGKPALQKSATMHAVPCTTESTPLLQDVVEERPLQVDSPSKARTRYYTVREEFPHHASDDSSGTLEAADGPQSSTLHKSRTNETVSSHNPGNHHHHVPTNAFLSIGLQTSIAIALHKLPEGFITYATNHANPQLGVAVFLALFIHNITEGFAMALPLYLAIQHRGKAMAISFALGGLSQPLGAAVAAVWFKLAGTGNWAPDESVYGGMFAVTAGIMASVALQLFSESLDLTHSKILCMIGAFCGMFILGISSALTA